jgi:tetratricopeptide (TPR) repeat protein
MIRIAETLKQARYFEQNGGSSGVEQVLKLLKPLLDQDLTDKQKVKVLSLLGKCTYKWESVDYLKRVLDLDPENTFALEWLGWQYQLLAKWEKCADHLMKAYKLNPKSDFLYPIGECLITADRYDDGVIWLKKALADDSENSVIMASLGYAYLLKGDHENCIKLLNNALKINPEDQSAAWNLQVANLGAGNTNSLKIKSKEDWDRIIPLEIGEEKN